MTLPLVSMSLLINCHSCCLTILGILDSEYHALGKNKYTSKVKTTHGGAFHYQSELVVLSAIQTDTHRHCSTAPYSGDTLLDELMWNTEYQLSPLWQADCVLPR
jgi:hypothetical protein